MIRWMVFVVAAFALAACGSFLPTPDDRLDGDREAGVLPTTPVDGGEVDGTLMAAAPDSGVLFDGMSDAPTSLEIKATLLFTGIAAAGAPSGTVTFDREGVRARVEMTGAVPGQHSVEIWEGTSCDALVQLLMTVGTVTVDGAGAVGQEVDSTQSRSWIDGKAITFHESDGRVSACGLATGVF